MNIIRVTASNFYDVHYTHQTIVNKQESINEAKFQLLVHIVKKYTYIELTGEGLETLQQVFFEFMSDPMEYQEKVDNGPLITTYDDCISFCFGYDNKGFNMMFSEGPEFDIDTACQFYFEVIDNESKLAELMALDKEELIKRLLIGEAGT
ncbi:hypothetical protein D3C78_20510 [compost metagenome]